MNYTKSAFDNALAKHQITQGAWALQNKLHASDLSKLLSGKTKFTPAKTLRALLNGWPDAATGYDMAVAYFRDELERGNLPADMLEFIVGGAQNPADAQLDADLNALRQLAMMVDGRQNIHIMANGARAALGAVDSDTQQPQVAENHTTYKAKKP